jgi:hypothetical protein
MSIDLKYSVIFFYKKNSSFSIFITKSRKKLTKVSIIRTHATIVSSYYTEKGKKKLYQLKIIKMKKI